MSGEKISRRAPGGPPDRAGGGGSSVERVRAALAALGVRAEIVTLPGSARTSQEAADQVGCRVDQIAKSLVFRGRLTSRPVLVIASGAHRVDPERVATLVAEPVDKADADYVRTRTGFAIGGVAPVGHAEPLATLLDEELLRWPEIWAAAGHPRTVFRITPAELAAVTGGRVAAVRQGGSAPTETAG